MRGNSVWPVGAILAISERYLVRQGALRASKVVFRLHIRKRVHFYTPGAEAHFYRNFFPRISKVWK